jgi:hypothetical protein
MVDVGEKCGRKVRVVDHGCFKPIRYPGMSIEVGHRSMITFARLLTLDTEYRSGPTIQHLNARPVFDFDLTTRGALETDNDLLTR